LPARHADDEPAGYEPRPGVRVRVPFGRQRLVGIVHSIATSSEVPVEKLKPLLEVIDAEPVIDAGVLELLAFAASYYHHSIGEVVSAALPKLARNGAAAQARVERWFGTEAGHASLASGELNRAKRQRELLQTLSDMPGISTDELGKRFADTRCARSVGLRWAFR